MVKVNGEPKDIGRNIGFLGITESVVPFFVADFYTEV